MEYYAYRPDFRWKLVEIFKLAAICILVAVIFYDRIYMALFMLPIGMLLWRLDKKSFEKRVRHKLRQEFKEFIILLSGDLNAGYSLEQGIRRAYEDMSRDESFTLIPRELALITNGMGLNQDVDELLLNMGQRCQEESIIELARLIGTAKRYGGNINTLINKTKKKLNDKLLVEREIETMVAAKKLEGNIMLFMPFGIVVYMRLTNGEYMELLYQTLVGNVVVTCALCLICICGLMIKKITEIEV